jgi:16S rRNA (cytidine1402-2'-O)-methyltransferase
MGTLYLVATPIGNLDDMTARAIRVLRDVALIAAEDTRSAKHLLDHYAIAAKLTSYNEHNARLRTPSIMRALDEGDVAVVSDAGKPGISDPGHHLVVAAVAAGHRVVPIPGASAVTAAVAASGLPSRRFHYLGFLPRQPGPRKRALLDASLSGDTIVLFESPHRLRATLADALEALGDRRIAVARELTKIYEEIWRGTIGGALEHFLEPRGEFALVIEGERERPEVADDDTIRERVAEFVAAGMSPKSAVSMVAETYGVSRRKVYQLWHVDSSNDGRMTAN